MLRAAFLATLATLLLAATASAQRPSLSAVEAEIAQTQAANCAKADVDGDTYRPVYCTPECGCQTNAPYPPGATCVETAPATWRVQSTSSYDAACAGRCLTDTSLCLTDADCGGSSGSCRFGWGTCSDDSTICLDLPGFECSPGASCSGPFGPPSGICTPDQLDFVCSSASDCPTGWDCAAGLCALSACSSAGACGSGTVETIYFEIENVQPAGDLAAASCDGTPITSNDAAACLQEVEASLGQACTPLP